MSQTGYIDPSLYSLFPQEEVLEVEHKAGQLFIGIPRETCMQEKRVALTPESVNRLCAQGHRVHVETDAGKDARFTDRDFSEAGAQIEQGPDKIYEADIILKVEPPSPEEIERMKPKQTLISALQLRMRDKAYFEALSAKKITALSFEGIQDESGIAPIVRSMSEIAGGTSILIAAELMNNLKGGSGRLLGGVSGVPAASVAILGAGTVGTYAAKTALGLGAQVMVFDGSLSRLRRLQEAVQHPLNTSIMQPSHLRTALSYCDVAIGAVRSQKGRTPCMVSEEMVQQMKAGSVIVDVSIDQGGVFESSRPTDHDRPTFEEHGIVHYCVPNIPSRVSRTASAALSNVLGPLLDEVGQSGGLEELLRRRKGVRSGLYLYNGVLTSKVLGEYYGLSYSEADLFFGS